MLKHVFAGIALVAAGATPALAQDASEITKVQNGQSCPGCNLFQADLAYLDLADINVSGARLRQSDMSLSTFDDWKLQGTNLSVSNLFGARFNHADFTNANLGSAALVGTYLGSSIMTGVNLDGANVSGADLSLVKGLTQSQLDSACGDETTLLPDGLTVPPCR